MDDVLLGTNETKNNNNDHQNNDNNDSMLFDSAYQALTSPLHQSDTIDTIQKASDRRKSTVSDMRTYLHRIGILDAITSNVDRIIHITGTKGKGSTACFCDSILRHAYCSTSTKTTNQQQQTSEEVVVPVTTGMFTSPHLVDVRERIRINGKPVSKRIFGQAYWTIRRRLEEYNGNNNDNNERPILPGYFRMVTLLAMYIFVNYEEPKIDVIILEVGMGGRYDATNIIDMIKSTNTTTTAATTCDDISDKNNADGNSNVALSDNNSSNTDPIVACGVTLLDYDHCRVLGYTLEDIAWEKGGIYQVRKGTTHPITPHPSTTLQKIMKSKTTTNKEDDITTTNNNNTSMKRKYETEELENTANNENDGTTLKTCETKQQQVQQRRSFFALDTNTPSSLNVLQQCAYIEGEGTLLQIVDTKNNCKIPSDYTIGLFGSHQRSNAEMAVALCQAVMMNPTTATTTTTKRPHPHGTENDGHNDDNGNSINSDDTPPVVSYNYNYRGADALRDGLMNASWPGRCQTIAIPSNHPVLQSDSNNNNAINNKVTLRLDGAHTIQSMQSGLEWFQSVVTQHQVQQQPANGNAKCILLFNCHHERNPVELIELIQEKCHFDCVYFCIADSSRPSSVIPKNAYDLLKDANKLSGKNDDDDEWFISPNNNNGENKSSLITWQDTLCTIWKCIEARKTKTSADSSATGAWDKVFDIASNLNVTTALQRGIRMACSCSNDDNNTKIEVLVTGSLYLVGSMLNAIGFVEPDAEGRIKDTLPHDREQENK